MQVCDLLGLETTLCPTAHTKKFQRGRRYVHFVPLHHLLQHLEVMQLVLDRPLRCCRVFSGLRRCHCLPRFPRRRRGSGRHGRAIRLRLLRGGSHSIAAVLEDKRRRPRPRESTRAASGAASDVKTSSRRAEGHGRCVEQRAERRGRSRTARGTLTRPIRAQGKRLRNGTAHVALRRESLRVAGRRNPRLHTLLAYHHHPLVDSRSPRNGCSYFPLALRLRWLTDLSANSAHLAPAPLHALPPHPLLGLLLHLAASRPAAPTPRRRRTRLLLLPCRRRPRYRPTLRRRAASLVSWLRWLLRPVRSLSARRSATVSRTCSSAAPTLPQPRRHPLRPFSSSRLQASTARSRPRVSSTLPPASLVLTNVLSTQTSPGAWSPLTSPLAPGILSS